MKMSLYKDYLNEIFSRQSANLDAIFFCPEGFVTEHFNAMNYLAKILQKQAYKIGFIKCYGIFERCPSFGASGISIAAKKEAFKDICRKCYKNQKSIDKNIQTISLNFYKAGTQNRAKKLSGKLLKKIINEKSFEFAKIFELEFVLATKKLQFNKTDKVDVEIMQKLVSSFSKAYLIAKNIIKKYQPNACLAFNDYITNLGFLIAAKKMHKKIFVVTQAANKNIDRSRIIIRNNFSAIYLRNSLKKWLKWKRLPLSKCQIHEIIEDIKTRLFFSGSHIYSNPINEISPQIIEKAKKAKQTVCFFTSSLDEIIAEQNQYKALSGKTDKFNSMFNCDLKNLHKKILILLKEAAKKNKDIYFIVRIHPREGITKRENFSSEHYEILKTELNNVPDNMQIIFPEERVSSYFLAQISDQVYTAWSTIGYELARLGVPVSTFTTGLSGFPRVSSVLYIKNKASFYRNLNSPKKVQISIKKVIEAFRVWNFKFLSDTFNFSKDLKNNKLVFSENKNVYKNELNKVIFAGKEISDFNIKLQKKTKNSCEKQIILSELSKVAANMNAPKEKSFEIKPKAKTTSTKKSLKYEQKTLVYPMMARILNSF
jgi:hypothetical protein